MSADLAVLLDKALKALPPKSAVRAEIVEALKQRAAHSERAAKLCAQNRYNEDVVRKLRQDWLTYMDLVQSRESTHFLASEAEGENGRDRCATDLRKEELHLTAIEDGFAEAVGPEAVDTLRLIRAKDLDAFSRSGELAPDGYRWRIYYPPGQPEEPVPRT
jgi:hypothetical protein